jgi:trans-aconitate 2-methyltransferase
MEPGSGTRWDGAEYDRVNGLQRWVADRTLAEVVLRGDERVLDVGCGDGRITAEIAARVPDGSVLGIDPSPGMLELARSRATANLAFAPGAVETMSYADEFDTVLSFNALHWVADQAAALERIRRALVPAGGAVLQLVCEGERPSVEDVALAVTRRAPWQEAFVSVPPPYHHTPPERLAELAERAGFAVDELRVDDLSWDFGEPAALLAWCRAGFADWLVHLPDDDARDQWLAEVGTAYAEVAGDDHVVRFLQLRLALRAA